MQQSSENRIRLYFPDMQKLWAFAKTLTGHAIEINTATRCLTCNCSEADLEAAVSQFGARLETMTSSN